MKSRTGGVSRRRLLAAAGTVGAAALTSRPALAQQNSAAPATGLPATGLPARGEFTIRKACILTMDDALGDLMQGDIHVRNGEIVAVAASTPGGGAEIDGSRFIVMPGLIDTHQHHWTSFFRGVIDDIPAIDYFPAKKAFSPVMTPQDTFRSVRLGLVQTLNAGITTTHNMAHNMRNAEHADATLRAHQSVGMRARFSYGHYDGLPKDKTIDFGDVARLKQKLQSESESLQGLIHLGVFLRNPIVMENSTVHRIEFAKARELGLTIALDGPDDEDILQMGHEGLLGPDLLFSHANSASNEARAMMAAARTVHTSSPLSEMSSTKPLPATSAMLDDGILSSLSIDSTARTDADLFVIMRVALSIVRTTRRLRKTPKFSWRDVTRLATIDGARALGIDRQVGSLTPGKRADLIMVHRTGLNLGLTSNLNPYRVLVSAQSRDVDTVSVDGRIFKREGKLTAVNPDAILAEAAESIERVTKLARWRLS
jgi:5-methylthioadenosine/S-adenosylhomocysteine deaminase